MSKRQREIVMMTGIDPVIAKAIADVERRIERERQLKEDPPDDIKKHKGNAKTKLSTAHK